MYKSEPEKGDDENPQTERFEGLKISETELLSALKAERLNSIGFEDNGDIEEQREQALEYIKGEMTDVPSRKNRSSVVASDVADAIETAMPDLMEIFTGGEDVGTFKPQGPEDEEQSKLETDYVNEVIFDQNPGFMVLETALRDALEIKTGLIKFHWANGEASEESYQGKTAEELMLAAESAEIEDVEEVEGPEGLPLYNFTARMQEPGRCVIEAVDPQNFGVSPDTVLIEDTPYCIERSFPRAFQLIDEGYDADMVQMLAPSAEAEDDEQARARDTVDETDDSHGIYTDTRRIVEVHTHTIRIDGDQDGQTELWCVVTDSEESLILDAYKKNRVGYASGSPYRRAHRFYGFSLADKLIEVQKIKTSLMRMLLDNGYFALNQRMEVAETKASKNTIADLLRNEPGLPVRSKTGDAVRPISAGGINWDITGALEYFSTVAEQRTGIARNAQGLNPDTLHDTAKGAMALMNAAQRRLRMIARVLAETLVKGLFVGVHGEIRDHASQAMQARVNGRWMAIDPTSWGNRSDMTIEVGVGSGGREMEVAAIMQVIALQKEALEAQAAGIIGAPMVSPQNLYASASRLIERLGLKAPERYFTDPAQAAQQMQGQPEGPSPEEQAAMAEMQMKQQAQQADIQLQQAKAQADAEAAREKNALDIQLAQEKAQAELQLARERMAAEMQLAREKAMMEAQIRAETAANANLTDNRPGGSLAQ
jgi:hypothetical protein